MMKQLILALSALMFSTLSHAKPTVVYQNVTICAAQCANESLDITGHNEANIGKIYYATATAANMENTNVCLQNSRVIKVTSNRLGDYSFNSCVDALVGKYAGKAVTINTQDSVPGNDEAGYVLSIK